MAAKIISPSEAVSATLTFKDLFTCLVCKEESVQPFYLSCGDVVCEVCMMFCDVYTNLFETVNLVIFCFVYMLSTD